MKKQKTKTANKIIEVERWVEHYGNKNKDWDGITAEQLPNGKWKCEIDIPRVGIKVRTICNTESNAMLRAGDKAYKAIKEFLLAKKTDKKIEIVKNWEMKIGENGEFMSIGLSKNERKRKSKQQFEEIKKSFEVVDKAIDKIGRIVGSTKNLVIQVFDKSIFPKNMDNNQILNETNDMVIKQFKELVLGECVIKDNLIIYLGYTFDYEGA